MSKFDASDILALVMRECDGDLKAALDALEDGAALAALGIGDADQVSVELAHDECAERLRLGKGE